MPASRSNSPRKYGICLAAAVLVLIASSSPFASTITVTNTNDSGPGSLRDAIASAADGDTILFSLSLPNTITVGTPLTIDSSQHKSLTISGPGASLLAINGADSVVVFVIQPLFGLGGPVDATISGLSIEHGSSGLGGGIFNAGTLTLMNCIVQNNAAQFGGGIFNAGTLISINSTVSGNSTTHIGFDHGGGIYNDRGSVSLTSSAVSSNVAHLQGGGIVNDHGTLSLTGSIVSNNAALLSNSQGGGIMNLFGTVTGSRSTISSNSARLDGGGIFNHVGDLTLTDSTVSGNSTGTDQDLFNQGGGIYSQLGSLTLIRSTVSGNLSNLGGGIRGFNEVATITNSTVANNAADIAGGGWFAQKVQGTVTNSTFSGNSGGGVTGNESTAFSMKSSIVANNAGGNCSQLVGVSIGYNLADDQTCPFDGSKDFFNTPAGLDPGGLRNNGGPTETIALLAASAAVDAIPVGHCTGVNGTRVATDQRGVPRPQGSACDIGAYEFFASQFLIEVVGTFQIINAVTALGLPAGTQQGLIGPLQAAADSLNRGDTQPAISELDAFVNQVDGLVRGGALPSSTASPLTAAAQGIIDALSN